MPFVDLLIGRIGILVGTRRAVRVSL
jgi:hypothetical protein